MKRAHVQTLAATANRVFALVTHDKKYRVVEVLDGRSREVTRAPSGMWLTSAFDHPTDGVTLVLASRQGKTHIVCPDSGRRGKTIEIPTAGTGPSHRGYVSDLVNVANCSVLFGMGTQLYEWSGTEWKDEHATLAVAATATSSVNDVVEVDGQPVVACNLGGVGGETRIIGRRADRTWGLVATVAGDINALAYRAADRTLFALGASISVISMMASDRGQLVETFKGPQTMWGAAVFAGALFARGPRTVYRVDGQAFTIVRPESQFTTNHDHALRSFGAPDRLYFAREDMLEIFDGEVWRSLPADDLL